MAILFRPMRRSALLSPWGVGAIVPFPGDESLMIAGLDMWQYSNTNAFRIVDERLQKRLRVSELRQPPDFRDPNEDPANSKLRIPAVRFPTWHYCPFCGLMERARFYDAHPPRCTGQIQWEKGRKCKPSSYGRQMIPERFVVICPNGHIDDFPVAEWLHSDDGYEYHEGRCHIRRSTGGASAALTGVYYSCTCGAHKSLGGATRPGALQRTIDYHCHCSRPWLGIDNENIHDSCSKSDKARVVLRGATNVWFGESISSITIPTENEAERRRVVKLVNDYYETLISSRVNGELNRQFIVMIATANHVDPDTFYEAIVQKLRESEGETEDSDEISEDEYRLAEYGFLTKTYRDDENSFRSINHAIADYNPVISDFFKSISLVPKLRETRAFVGFSRIEPEDIPLTEKKKKLRLGNEDWLPAIEVFGEGIFFEFSGERLTEWAQRADVAERISKLNHSFSKSRIKRGTQGNLRPEYVLIHTFAHLLINQLSFDCGYGSSSLRERIYCEKTENRYNMYGLLIYTASGDSEGSLGGLVRQGEADNIEQIIVNAIKNALWCTSDPVCIQSAGQGPESCNLAACHNCALLPETCCECGNRLLDRGVVVGTLDNTEMGYFRKIREL